MKYGFRRSEQGNDWTGLSFFDDKGRCWDAEDLQELISAAAKTVEAHHVFKHYFGVDLQ